MANSLASPDDPRVTHHFADVGEVVLHYVTAGSGPPVILLHGWPQTWWEWRHVIPVLADHYTVITPDMRGLGDSSRPLDGYDKKTIAADIWQLAHERLGYESFLLVGHDWGGPVAYALAAAHPDAVGKLVVLDVVVPGCGGDFSQGGRRWHHQFHMTPDLPETLVTGREAEYLGWFYRTFSYRPDAIGTGDMAEYLRTYTQPGALRAGFAYYRLIPEDAANNAAIIKDFKLSMPVLALGGAVSYPHGRGRGMEPAESLRRVANNVIGGVVPDCGHFIPEEAPDYLCNALLSFFAR